MWCIGNHGVYRSGPFQQYVHMIEIAANGALQEELALVRERGARLHVIRPRVPLPLDPDFFFGRIDASTLIAMGYRDAVAYLDGPRETRRRERDADARTRCRAWPSASGRSRRARAAADVGGRRPGRVRARTRRDGRRRRTQGGWVSGG